MGGQLGWEIPEEGWRKGPWTAEEDRLLIEYVSLHGEGRWNSVARLAGLKRNGKSCRLRWVNYLRPDLKRGRITPHEENIILELHARWGNRWSTIARNLPGRTDNEIKNYWRTHFKKKEKVSPRDQTEKTKARLLRRQQFQYQQQLKLQQQQEKEDHHQQLQLEQQQQQQQQQNQLALKTLMAALLEESDHNNITKVPSLTMYPYPNNTIALNQHHHHHQDQHYYCLQQQLSSMLSIQSGDEHGHHDDDDEMMMLWGGGLWSNMDDIHASFDHGNGTTASTTRAHAQTQVTPFC